MKIFKKLKLKKTKEEKLICYYKSENGEILKFNHERIKYFYAMQEEDWGIFKISHTKYYLLETKNNEELITKERVIEILSEKLRTNPVRIGPLLEELGVPIIEIEEEEE